MDFLTDDQLRKMYGNSYYLLNILLQLDFSYSNSIPTAGVTFADKRLKLLVNRKFIQSLSPDAQVCVMLHEALHIHYNHLFADKSLFPDRMRLNVAQDLAINSHPEIAWLKQEKIGVFASDYELPEGETTAYYYANLPEDLQPPSCGEHEHTELPSEALGELLKVKHKAAKATEIKNKSVEVVHKAYDWRRVLANFIASSDNYDAKVTWKKSNRRASELPGRKKLRHLNVAVVIDTSGSMLDYLGVLAGQVAEIANTNQAEVTVLQCDAQLTTAPVAYKKGSSIALVGGGGTAYQPGLDAAKALNSDVVIYLGDMEHFDALQNPGCAVLFFNVVNRTKPNANFGSFLHL